MPIASMTGFARASAESGAWRLAVEIKCVNAKGLDLRLRVPANFDVIEPDARSLVSKSIVRGSCYVTLTAERTQSVAEPTINRTAFARLAAAAKEAAGAEGLSPPTADGLLAVHGVVVVAERDDDEETMAAIRREALAVLGRALAELCAMRALEGAALERVLAARLDAIERLTAAADANPARRPEAIRARLAEAVASLLQSSRGLDENRLHQEAIMLATKADVREELDRLRTHVTAARALIASGGAVGRRLDFLSQELGREANTLCSKSNDVSLTTQGLELKAEIEQLREQVQNIE